MACGHAIDDQQASFASRVEIGMPHGVPIDRRIIERRQIHGRNESSCRQDLPGCRSQCGALDLGNWAYLLIDDAFGFIDREQRTRKKQSNRR